jgi:hypothetical protein
VSLNALIDQSNLDDVVDDAKETLDRIQSKSATIQVDVDTKGSMSSMSINTSLFFLLLVFVQYH